ncbi:MAG: betaine/proline/choline family ABC transporter ATP-binding protein [Firmicutes bacterium]|nr:betaine/proline/choline family ABC transporter ATP-binding protein [Bacillota bacterium]
MLELKNVTKIFGKGSAEFKAVNSVNLKVRRGELAVLIGPSGCGKTTTLKMINRLVEPTSGQILFRGKCTSESNHVELRRNIGYVIQSIGLFPHLTIAANIEIVPRLKKWSREKRQVRTRELLELVNLDPEIYADRYPSELSGGEQQRIGVLRALAIEPDLILMDEPFGALDPITREQLQVEIKQLQRSLKKTVVFVTHDMDEALKLADTIVLMKDGKIIQRDAPERMMAEPVNDFVREFIGEDRLIPLPNITPVSEVMVTDPLVVSEKTSLQETLRAMQKKRSDFAVVTKANQTAAGIISAGSVQEVLLKKGIKLLDLVGDGPQDGIIRGSTTIRDAAASLTNGAQVLCVVDRNNKPIGLVNRHSLLKGLVDIWDENESGSAED